MKLAECKIGSLVCVKAGVLETDELRIGHITGLADPDNINSDTVLNRIKNKPGLPPAPKKVWPVVLFAGNQSGVVINYEDIEPFTAY